MRLYRELAPWWSVLVPPESYAEEAAAIFERLSAALGRAPGSILELGGGAGGLASHLSARCEVVGVELSPQMVAEARRHAPASTQIEGDLRTARLQYGIVPVHAEDEASSASRAPRRKKAEA